MNNERTALQFTKVRDVASPNRGTKGSAGIDFFIPSDFHWKILSPGNSILIPSGIKANIPDGYALIAFNKSGVAVKKGLILGACVIDSDYEGEIHFDIKNVSNTESRVHPDDKIAQFLLVPVNHCDLEEVANEDILFRGQDSERGIGGFGSTGTSA